MRVTPYLPDWIAQPAPAFFTRQAPATFRSVRPERQGQARLGSACPMRGRKLTLFFLPRAARVQPLSADGPCEFAPKSTPSLSLFQRPLASSSFLPLLSTILVKFFLPKTNLPRPRRTPNASLPRFPQHFHRFLQATDALPEPPESPATFRFRSPRRSGAPTRFAPSVDGSLRERPRPARRGTHSNHPQP